jgi:hypothetical protein
MFPRLGMKSDTAMAPRPPIPIVMPAFFPGSASALGIPLARNSLLRDFAMFDTTKKI